MNTMIVIFSILAFYVLSGVALKLAERYRKYEEKKLEEIIRERKNETTL